MDILKLAIKDFFSFKFLKFALIPLIFSLIFMLFLGVLGFSALLDYFNSLFSVREDSFWAWFYALHFVQILITIISFLFSGFIVVFASVFLALFITSFLSPFIVKEINQKYYRYDNINEISTLKIIFEIFKIFIKFIGILLLCTLALFLPFINIFVYYLAFYYLFHKLLMIDITSTILDKESFKNFHSNFSPLEFKFSTLCFYLLSSVPLLGLFLQVFFVIFLTHLAYQRILKLKAKT
ncbi:TPA: EI24 domain-containing protein [Campylobacter jejuni]|uniref:EI24 domain-containing protein n=1 Tax=Campylobacter jejuni TaxID=197 RepID=UPI0013AA967C|nr:EI24 domain-containing protein [Campylobacter jejuni]MBY7062111.1 EI24 domain-containing protein [Campylobacter jejuni]MBY7067487.1 EI24 domain-containing protein [Campylobacter jejuni]MBY7072854.1 EI24 domain-containing protein [Campylobacter jejuni]MBY7074446.1 EI24 domain-containing protein [Campylobacter jejuni]MBY7076040.1 EI24 domain-containing protein [Campylobacter jejuni]